MIFTKSFCTDLVKSKMLLYFDIHILCILHLHCILCCVLPHLIPLKPLIYISTTLLSTWIFRPRSSPEHLTLDLTGLCSRNFSSPASCEFLSLWSLLAWNPVLCFPFKCSYSWLWLISCPPFHSWFLSNLIYLPVGENSFQVWIPVRILLLDSGAPLSAGLLHSSLTSQNQYI